MRPRELPDTKVPGPITTHPQHHQQHARDTISLDQFVGDEENTRLSDLVEDADTPVAVDVVATGLLQDQLRQVLETLSSKEAGVIRLRFGLTDGRPRTLERHYASATPSYSAGVPPRIL